MRDEKKYLVFLLIYLVIKLSHSTLFEWLNRPLIHKQTEGILFLVHVLLSMISSDHSQTALFSLHVCTKKPFHISFSGMAFFELF